MNTTYRIISLSNPNDAGPTAATPELAKLAAGKMRRSERLAMEEMNWVEKFDKMILNRSVIIEAEEKPGDWELGLGPNSDDEIS